MTVREMAISEDGILMKMTVLMTRTMTVEKVKDDEESEERKGRQSGIKRHQQNHHQHRNHDPQGQTNRDVSEGP